MISTNNCERQIFKVFLCRWEKNFYKNIYPYKYRYYISIFFFLSLVNILLFWSYNMSINKRLFFCLCLFIAFNYLEIKNALHSKTITISNNQFLRYLFLSIYFKSIFFCRYIFSFYVFFTVLDIGVFMKQNYSKLLFLLNMVWCVSSYLELLIFLYMLLLKFILH